MRYERSFWNVMGLNECIYRKHMEKSTRYVFIYCTTTGWWGNIEVLNQTLSQSTLVREWGSIKTPGVPKCFLSTVPIGKPVMVFIATRNIFSMKTISDFRGFILWLAVRLNNAPIRCNYFPLCLQAINGANFTQK